MIDMTMDKESDGKELFVGIPERKLLAIIDLQHPPCMLQLHLNFHYNGIINRF